MTILGTLSRKTIIKMLIQYLVAPSYVIIVFPVGNNCLRPSSWTRPRCKVFCWLWSSDHELRPDVSLSCWFNFLFVRVQLHVLAPRHHLRRWAAILEGRWHQDPRGLNCTIGFFCIYLLVFGLSLCCTTFYSRGHKHLAR